MWRLFRWPGVFGNGISTTERSRLDSVLSRPSVLPLRKTVGKRERLRTARAFALALSCVSVLGHPQQVNASPRCTWAWQATGVQATPVSVETHSVTNLNLTDSTRPDLISGGVFWAGAEILDSTGSVLSYALAGDSEISTAVSAGTTDVSTSPVLNPTRWSTSSGPVLLPQGEYVLVTFGFGEGHPSHSRNPPSL